MRISENAVCQRSGLACRPDSLRVHRTVEMMSFLVSVHPNMAISDPLGSLTDHARRNCRRLAQLRLRIYLWPMTRKRQVSNDMQFMSLPRGRQRSLTGSGSTFAFIGSCGTCTSETEARGGKKVEMSRGSSASASLSEEHESPPSGMRERPRPFTGPIKLKLIVHSRGR